jgi:hypothetical protein
MAATLNLHVVVALTAITYEPLGMRNFITRQLVNIHTVNELLFINQQLETWRRCEIEVMTH